MPSPSFGWGFAKKRKRGKITGEKRKGSTRNWNSGEKQSSPKKNQGLVLGGETKKKRKKKKKKKKKSKKTKKKKNPLEQKGGQFEEAEGGRRRPPTGKGERQIRIWLPGKINILVGGGERRLRLRENSLGNAEKIIVGYWLAERRWERGTQFNWDCCEGRAKESICKGVGIPSRV